MPVSLHPEQQLDLAARKLLAARLLRLSRSARMERDHAAKSEIDDDAIFRPNGSSARLLQIFDMEIYDQLREDEARAAPASLIDFLDRVADQVERATSHIPDRHTEQVRSDLRTETRQFDCGSCGRRDLVCNGGIVDSQLMADPQGGRCLRFVAEMIESFARAAEECYRDVAGDRAPSTIVPSVVLETHRKARNSGTLPIDGEFQQPLAGADAVIRIFWPIDGTLDKAILSLPYLVFHEVFVHGAQGAARPGPRFQVHDTCAFTEGAVDAVACDLLLDRVLDEPENLPVSMEALAADLHDACRAYHEKRFKYSADETHAALLDPADRIRHARYLGRRQVYQLLRQVQATCKRPPDWAQRVILMLNLHLDRDQRRTIFKLFRQISGRKIGRLNLADPLDVYLEDGDADRLLDRLSGLTRR